MRHPSVETFLTNWYFSVILLCVHSAHDPMGPIWSNYRVRADIAARDEVQKLSKHTNKLWLTICILCKCYLCPIIYIYIYVGNCGSDSGNDDGGLKSPTISDWAHEKSIRYSTWIRIGFCRAYFFPNIFVTYFRYTLSFHLSPKIVLHCNKLCLRDYGIIRAFIDINKIYVYF